jgi:hypothetical protein
VSLRHDEWDRTRVTTSSQLIARDLRMEARLKARLKAIQSRMILFQIFWRFAHDLKEILKQIR